MLSATGLVARAVEAMRLGAVNYLVKPVDLDTLAQLELRRPPPRARA